MHCCSSQLLSDLVHHNSRPTVDYHRPVDEALRTLMDAVLLAEHANLHQHSAAIANGHSVTRVGGQEGVATTIVIATAITVHRSRTMVSW